MTFSEFVDAVPGLTKREVNLLRPMYASKGCWITTAAMVRDMWGDITFDEQLMMAGHHNVHVVINRLRKKFDGSDWRIETAKPDRSAIGYRLVHR